MSAAPSRPELRDPAGVNPDPAAGGMFAATALALLLADRHAADPKRSAALRAALRQLLHVCVRLAFAISAQCGQEVLAVAAEAVEAWDADEAAQDRAAVRNPPAPAARSAMRLWGFGGTAPFSRLKSTPSQSFIVTS
jgi:hypothetical protein